MWIFKKLERVLNKTETTRNRGKNKINKRNNLEVESSDFQEAIGDERDRSSEKHQNNMAQCAE